MTKVGERNCKKAVLDKMQREEISKMKKVLIVLLGALMMLTVTACGSDAGWLPYDLEFGQSYEDFCATLVENGFREPALKAASSNNGYLTDIIYENGNVLEWDFLHAETLTSFANCEDAYERIDYTFANPGIAFSFNQKKELYEMYCLFEDLGSNDFFGNNRRGNHCAF